MLATQEQFGGEGRIRTYGLTRQQSCRLLRLTRSRTSPTIIEYSLDGTGNAKGVIIEFFLPFETRKLRPDFSSKAGALICSAKPPVRMCASSVDSIIMGIKGPNSEKP